MDRISNINQQVQQNKTFHYTQGQEVMTPEERQFYEDNGYLLVKGLLKKEEYSKWVERFLEYCDEKIERPPGMAMVRDISLVKKGQKVKGEAGVTKIQDWQDDEVLFTYCNHPKVLAYVRDIVGLDVKSTHTMLINKPPNTGKTQRHPLHQDLAYFPFRPANQIVCAWSAMEPANRENGGLVIYPGTHKGEFVKHGYPNWKEGVNRGYWGIMDMPPESAHKVHPDMQAGDVVFFHPHVIHGSGQNRTQNYRKSISCHYANANCKYIDTTGTFHESLAKDIMDMAKNRYGFEGQYTDIWRNKIRLVSGKENEEGI